MYQRFNRLAHQRPYQQIMLAVAVLVIMAELVRHAQVTVWQQRAGIPSDFAIIISVAEA